MPSYHVWITVVMPIDEGAIIAGLITRGYDVEPAANDNRLLLLSEGSLGYAMLACRVARETIDARTLYDDLFAVLTSADVQYYSTVISEFSAQSVWNSGNATGKYLSFADKPSKKNVN